MMKTYEKPMLVTLALSGNEQLCGSCSDDGASILLYQDSGLAGQFDWLVGDGDGNGERSDLIGCFGTGESGCSKPLEGYCKFTGNVTVAWS